MGMTKIGVMQIVDSLNAGGLERMAVNIANHLPADRYRSYLCTTRAEGPLAELISPDVARLKLQRAGRFDFGAIELLKSYVRDNQIDILHAHGTAVFVASRVPAKLIWHDHFGRYATEERPAWLYRLATRRAAGVIAVNQPLMEWSQRRLKVTADRVWYVPNFVSEPPSRLKSPPLPGTDGLRIVCVANLRPEKDHLTLLAAMREVIVAVPGAHLLLVGQAGDQGYLQRVQAAMPDGAVTWLGARTDVAAILRGCDVGVLSSASEGLPLALIEYGMNALPAVATQVGQCEEVLDGGRAGILVPPADPNALAAALVQLLRSPQERRTVGQRFRQRVLERHGIAAGIQRVTAIYQEIRAATES
jgi:glycosyltransferase involved in cell wall biosynthesis